MQKTVMMIMGSHRKHKNTVFFSERLIIALKDRLEEVDVAIEQIISEVITNEAKI